MFNFSSERCFLIVVYKTCYSIDPSVINDLAFGDLGSLFEETMNKSNQRTKDQEVMQFRHEYMLEHWHVLDVAKVETRG